MKVKSGMGVYVPKIETIPETFEELKELIKQKIKEDNHNGIKKGFGSIEYILIDDKKVSGTLIEYSGRFVVIGIGINIKTNPTVKANYKTTKLENYTNVTRDELLNKLMRNLDKWRNADFCDVRTRWTELAVGLNCNVKYRGEIMELIGINENGALVLRNGTRYVLVYGDEITMNTITS